MSETPETRGPGDRAPGAALGRGGGLDLLVGLLGAPQSCSGPDEPLVQGFQLLDSGADVALTAGAVT